MSANAVAIDREAAALLEDGRFLDALSVYEELTDAAFPIPWRAKAHLQMGGILSLFLDQFDDAAGMLGKAVTLDPHGPIGAEAHFRLGMIHHELGGYQEAAKAFEQYIEIEPMGANAATAEFLIGQCIALAGMPREEIPEEAAPSNNYPIRDTTLRVAVLKNQNAVSLSCKKRWRVSSMNGENPEPLEPGILSVSCSSSQVEIKSHSIRSHELLFSALEDGSVEVDGVPLPGEVNVIISKGKLLVVNIVDLEEYLRGVVPSEMPASWPAQALEAQAICARTYAIYQKIKRTDYEFDLLSTVESQVYGGARVRHQRSDMAVAATNGKILLHEGRPALTLFHSSSGGHTEDIGRVWGSSVPYLRGRSDPNSPPLDWSFTMSLKDVERALGKRGIKTGRLSEIVFEGKDESGRYEKVKIEGREDSVTVRSNRFRLSVGAGAMKSTRCEYSCKKGQLIVEGTGFGHGVGMSQWGAKSMAAEGLSAGSILEFYYPGTAVGRLVGLER